MSTSGSTNGSASLVSFEPVSQLTFQKTETGEGLEAAPVQDTLKITNLSETQDVLFRIQTTAPLTYRVKPSHGRIGVGETMTIQMVMVADSQKVDKFLIKYAPIDPSVSSADNNFIELFKSVELNAQEHRLKCNVLLPDGSSVVNLAGATSASPIQKDPSVASLAPFENAADVSQGASSVNEGPKEEALQKVPGRASPAPAVAEKVASVTAATVPSAPSTPSKDASSVKIQTLTSRNLELQRQVEELQKLVAKHASGSAASAQSPPPEWVALLQSQTGFPPILVILIAIFSFLLGLLF